MAGPVFFHPDRRPGEPLPRKIAVAEPGMSHGQKHVVKGIAAVAHGGRAVERADGGLEVARTIVRRPDGVPIGMALGLRRDNFRRQEGTTCRVSEARVGRIRQKPREVVGALAPPMIEARLVRMGRREPGQHIHRLAQTASASCQRPADLRARATSRLRSAQASWAGPLAPIGSVGFRAAPPKTPLAALARDHRGRRPASSR